MLVPESAFADTPISNQSPIPASENGGMRTSSLIFLSLSGNRQVTNGDSTHDVTGPVLDRGYITIRYRYNKVWRSRITSNIIADPNQTGQKAHAYLKYANLVGTFSPRTKLVLGLQHTPWIHYEQALDEHRYITRCLINSNDLDHSADAGLGIKGAFLDNRVAYWLTETEGGGYKDLKHSRVADFDSRVGLYPEGPSPSNGWTVDVQYRNGFLGKNLPGILNPSRHILYQAMTTYTYKNTIRIAAGYLSEHQDHYKEEAKNSSNMRGYYFWGWDKLKHHISGYCRYEFKQLSTKLSDIHEKKLRYVVALDYAPTKHLTLALAWDHTTYKNLSFSLDSTQENDSYGLYSRIRF